MIIDKDGEWVIATPPKCGTVSLQEALVPKYARQSRHRHTMTWGEPGERIMIIRNPYERFAAIYWRHNQRAGREGIYLNHLAHNINQYVEQWWLDRLNNPYSPWSFNLTEMAAVFRPTKVFKLEDGLDKLLRYVQYPSTVPHVNKNTNPKKEDWQATKRLLTPANYGKVQQFCEPDRKRFNY